MRLTLTLIGLIAAFAFGMMTVVNGMQTASAGGNTDDSGGDDVSIVCQNDDGDDDLPSNEEPRDDPDSEDGEAGITGAEPIIRIGGPEIGDSEDPYYEDDDCPQPTPFGFCGNMTEPGVYLFADANYGGECVHFTGDVDWINAFTCDVHPMTCWNDIASSIKLVGVPSGIEVCLHSFYDGNCEPVLSDLPNMNVIPNEQCGPPPPTCSMDNNLSSLRFLANPIAVPGDEGGPEASFAAADADCDGGVTVGDALANLQYLSGFSAGCAGNWDGDSVQGDADCSGAIGGGDVTAILVAVATGADPGC